MGERRPVVDRPSDRGRGHRSAAAVVGTLLVGAGVVELGWVVALILGVVPSTRADHHVTLWVALDLAEAAGLVLSGWGLRRRTSWVGVACGVTASLLVLDAVLDVMLSHPDARSGPILTALLLELPLAVVLGWAARRSSRAYCPSGGTVGP